MNKNLLPNIRITGAVLGAAGMLTFTGCVAYVDGPPPRTVYVSPAVQVEPVFIAEDDYVYYPQYGMYYGSRSHRYFRQERGSWVAAQSPRGVSEVTLRTAVSVNVNFHDSPAAHHSEVVRSYPKNWKPSGGKEGRHDDRRDDHQH